MVTTTLGSLFRQATDPANRANPYPLYAALRRTPVALQDDGTYVVSTYHETAQLLRDPRISSDPRQRTDAPLKRRGTRFTVHPPFLNLDPPAHDHARRMAMTPFGPPHTPGRIEGLRRRIDDLVGQHIDAQVGRTHLDVVAQLAFPLPVAVICQLLGVPAADADRVHVWSDAVASRIDPATVASATDAQRQAVEQAEADFAAYMGALLAERRRCPGDDLLSALVGGDDPPGRMNDQEAISTAMLLLIAGHETTVNLIANGVLTFLRHPGLLERVRRDPALLIGAVEEVLRYEPPVQFRERTTLTDMEVAGVRIPRGAPVVLLLAAANRDEARFPNAEAFIPEREDNQHLAFLTGLHYCFGAPLARLEAQIALREFVRRFEAPRLVVDPPPYRANAALRGPSELLVEVQRVHERHHRLRGTAA